MGTATQPNQVLMLDYTEGFGDPLLAMLTAPERSRKWAPWTIAANSCALIERSTGVAQIFFGSNNSSGKIYALTPGAFSDDGAAINSFYSTAFLAATGAALSGTKSFRLPHRLRARRGHRSRSPRFRRETSSRPRSAPGRSPRPPRATWSSSPTCSPSASRISSAPTPPARGSR